MRDYWAGRDLAGRRRIGMFGRNLYRHGLLGRTIQIGHAGLPPARQAAAAHARGQRASPTSGACSRPSSRRCSTAALVRHLADLPGDLFRPRHPARAVRRAEGRRRRQSRHRCCARASSGSPATSRSTTTGSPGRPSAGRYPATGARCHPTCAPRTSSAPRPGRPGRDRADQRSPTICARQDARTRRCLCPARRPGLDEPGADVRPMEPRSTAPPGPVRG